MVLRTLSSTVSTGGIRFAGWIAETVIGEDCTALVCPDGVDTVTDGGIGMFATKGCSSSMVVICCYLLASMRAMMSFFC